MDHDIAGLEASSPAFLWGFMGWKPREGCARHVSDSKGRCQECDVFNVLK
jgi:hypothetical protein